MTVDELIVTDFKYGIPMANIHKEKWVKYIDTTCIALEVDDCEMMESAFEEVFNKHLDIFKSIHPMAMNEVDGVTDETFYNIFIITYSKKWDDIKYDEDGDDDGC
jgi:hypothetical protein|tara:strand:- start:1355 stop:1669 length:315 start_codon:yes stop_codon:yes gene_type:complete